MKILFILFSVIIALTPLHSLAMGFDDIRKCERNAMRDLIQNINQFQGARRIEYPNAGPTKMIGQITTDLGRCNGTVYRDPHILITNAHCAFNSQLAWTPDLQPGNITFKQGLTLVENKTTHQMTPTFIKKITGRFVAAGTTNHENLPAQDWAIYLLDEPAVGTPLLPDTQTGTIPRTDIVMASYGEDLLDHQMLHVESCSTTTSSSSRVVQHYCSGMQGSSGGVLGRVAREKIENGKRLIADFKVVAINEGAKTKENVTEASKTLNFANRAVPIENIDPTVQAVIRLRNEGVPFETIVEMLKKGPGVSKKP